MPWGFHTIINAFRCCPKSIRSADNITDFSHTLVKRIDMVPFGKPQVVHFGSDDKAGYTLVQLIETSNIVAHFSEDTNCAYLDIFSCKPYDKKIVEATVAEFFKSEAVEVHYVERGPPEMK